ncbi:MAG TPA: TonB-dependent receptor [Gammaproteobacteria bacterium]|nr:TonB-dependent receptor [Gammaproteobacteria bacterium]
MHSLRWHHGLACCAAPTLLLGSAALAQQPAQGPLEEIVVRATMIERTLDRVPAAVSVIDEAAIQNGRQQLGLDEALSRVPGLFMQNRYNFAQDLRVSIRGFGARAQFGIRGIKVLVDGIPETLPDGQGSVDSIDLGATSQIEVIRGPSSSLYGNASGGVISLISEGGRAEPYAQVRVAAGGYGYEKAQFKFGGETDRLNYLVSLSNQELDGYRDRSAYENKLLTGRFDLDLGKDRSLLTVLNLTDQPISDDPGGLTAAVVPVNPRSAAPLNTQFLAGESLEQQRLGFVYTTRAGEHGTIRARNYYAWRDFGNLLPTLLQGIVDLDRKFAGGGVSYSYDGFWLDRPNRLVAGADFDDQDDDRRRYNNLNGLQGPLGFDQNEHVTSHGVFLQNELSISENVQLSFGVRFDEVEFEITDRFLGDGRDDSGSKSFDDTSPMVGLVVQLRDDLSFYTTYSSAFETPTTTEFNRQDGLGGFNQALEPQLARNFEVGLRGSVDDTQRYEIALFTIKVDDELIGREIPTSPGRNFFENAGETSRKGLELSWMANPTDRINATVSYTYSDFQFDRFNETVGTQTFNRHGLIIPGTAENTVFGEFEYRAPRGWYGAIDAMYVDEQFGDNGNLVVIPSYTLTNLRFGYDAEIGKLTLSPFLGINNAGDQPYTSNVRLNAAAARYFEPGPLRNAYAGITVDWKFR